MIMRLRCLLGHEGGPGTKVGDVIFAECWRCGMKVVRSYLGRWYPIPRKADDFSKIQSELGPMGADRLLRQARAEAPFLHRRRRRRVRAMDAYFW